MNCCCHSKCEEMPIRASFCTSDSLVQDGEFYLPDKIIDRVQRYRKETVEYDSVQGVQTLAISKEWYVKDKNGRFVIAGKDED